MSDTPAAPEPQGTPAAPTPTATAPATPAAPAQETDWKAEARKWETRAKENSDAASRLAEIEEANKTEAQKLAERAEAAEKAQKDAESQITRLKVIADAQIPADYQDLVQGADEAALKASAEKVAALIKPDGKRPAVGPYVPPEGTGAAGPLGGAAQDFADHLAQQLGSR